jgi:HD-like signal output (HDOD) protein
MLSPHQLRWGVDQWVAYLKDKEIPVLPRTKAIFQDLANLPPEEKEQISARDLANYVHVDPFFALKLLRRAERRRSSRLGQETTTALAAIMQIGVKELLTIVSTSLVCDSEYPGCTDCESRATMAASIARNWAMLRADISPDEVTLATLLSEIGELLMWYFAAELPLKSEKELASGKAFRSVQAQQQAVGFSFRQLTLSLAVSWELPALISQLIKGTDSPRANVARISIDTARHIVTDGHNPAIPADVVNIHNVLHGVTFEHLVQVLPIDDEYKATVLQAVSHEDNLVPDKYKL